MHVMENRNDRKAAVKKLRLLAFNSKSNVDAFRKKLDDAFKVVFLPNGVERSEYEYGGVKCDVLAPELYSSNRVMLYIHGGSYIGGSALSYRSFCSSLANKCFCRVIVPEYRLAPAYPFPAANEDVQNVFKNLFTEEQVACASLIYNLRDRYRSCIKQVILFSPWLDLSPSSKIISAKKACDDVLSSDVLRKSSSTYTYESNLTSPFVSPLLATDEQLNNFPPLYIQMGGKEMLLEDAKAFTDRMKELGNKCELDVWPDMMFMFQMADEYLHESHLALEKIGKIVTDENNGLQAVQIENKPRLEHSLKSEA